MKKLSDVKKAVKARAEYIKVGSNVHLHITDAGEVDYAWQKRQNMFFRSG
jgi:hypothetical protein